MHPRIGKHVECMRKPGNCVEIVDEQQFRVDAGNFSLCVHAALDARETELKQAENTA